MEIAPDLSDTLMHLSGYIFRAAINKALREKWREFRSRNKDRGQTITCRVQTFLSQHLVTP